jgi:hypothetical protein
MKRNVKVVWSAPHAFKRSTAEVPDIDTYRRIPVVKRLKIQGIVYRE